MSRCQARYGQNLSLHCEILIPEGRAAHLGDHAAIVDDQGNKISWTETVAMYPAVDDVPAPASERQVGGNHYRQFKIQPWDVIDEYGLDFYSGNALKYLLRRKTDRLEDLKKARHYLDKLIELEEGGDG